MSECGRKVHQRACPLHFKRAKDNQLSRWSASGRQRGDKGYKYGLNTGWKVQSRCLPWGEPSPGKGRQLRKASCIEGYRGESSLGRSSPGKGRQMRKLLPASRVSLGRILPGEILSRQGSANAKATSCIEGFPGENPPWGDPLQARVGKCESLPASRCFPGENPPWEILSRQGSANAKAASCIEVFPWGESSLGRSSPGKGWQMRKLLPASRFPWGESSPRNAKAASCNRDFVPTKNPPQVKAHHHFIPP